MSSQSQINANRENSLHSTGPKTGSGKSASSQNRGTHFLSSNATFRVLPDENQSVFEAQLATLLTDHQATDPLEASIIRRMAEHEWMRQRSVRHMDRMFSCEDQYAQPLRPRTEKEFALMMRYHALHQRAYQAALNELRTVRAERSKQQIGFERQTHQAERHDIQKQRHAAAEKARHLDAECKIIRTLRQSANNPEALERARHVAIQHQAA